MSLSIQNLFYNAIVAAVPVETRCIIVVVIIKQILLSNRINLKF